MKCYLVFAIAAILLVANIRNSNAAKSYTVKNDKVDTKNYNKGDLLIKNEKTADGQQAVFIKDKNGNQIISKSDQVFISDSKSSNGQSSFVIQNSSGPKQQVQQVRPKGTSEKFTDKNQPIDQNKKDKGIARAKSGKERNISVKVSKEELDMLEKRRQQDKRKNN